MVGGQCSEEGHRGTGSNRECGDIGFVKYRNYLEVFATIVLLSLAGQFKIPVPGIDVPITLQSMMVILLPIVFDWKNSSLGVGLFLIAACLGAPILSGGAGGFDTVTGSSFGFLTAFLIVNLITGLILPLQKGPRLIFLFILFITQHILIMISGLSWIALATDSIVTWSDYVAPFLPGLLIKSVMGSGLAEIAIRTGLSKQ
jgi:biotin transport system substrate-specific component